MRENSSADNSRSNKKPPLGVGPMFPRFSGQDIDDDCLGRVIEVARLAPTEWNLQTWRWIVVRGNSARKYLEAATLSDVLDKAHKAGVKVFAYDRLIRKSANVDYYSTFDNFKVGVLQANSLLQGLGVDKGKTGPFNIELFGGSPDDNNAFFFYDGAMSVLQPLIDKKVLVVQSGQMGMKTVGTLRWDGAVAQARMDNLLSAYYGKKRVDAVLSPYDGLSRGIISSLKGVGYGSADQPMPIVSGQDAELASVKAILAGEQYSTVFKDTRNLAKVTAQMVDAALSGKEVPVNDTKTYDNGVKVVPSNLLIPVAVDKSNLKEILVGSGYYTEDQISK